MKNEILLKGIEIAKSMGFETRVGGYDLEYFSLFDKDTNVKLSIQQTPYFRLAKVYLSFKGNKEMGSAFCLADNLEEITEDMIRKYIKTGNDFHNTRGIKKFTLEEFRK